MAEINRGGGEAFDSASFSRSGDASLRALVADRDAHFEKAEQCARVLLAGVIAVQEADGYPPTMYIPDGDVTQEDASAAKRILAIKQLKSELREAFIGQNKVWELREELHGREVFYSPARDHWDLHSADDMARQLLVACTVHLSLDGCEKVQNDGTDYFEEMSIRDGPAIDLYWEISKKSLALLRECLTQFIGAYDRYLKEF